MDLDIPRISRLGNLRPKSSLLRKQIHGFEVPRSCDVPWFLHERKEIHGLLGFVAKHLRSPCITNNRNSKIVGYGYGDSNRKKKKQTYVLVWFFWQNPKYLKWKNYWPLSCMSRLRSAKFPPLSLRYWQSMLQVRVKLGGFSAVLFIVVSDELDILGEIQKPNLSRRATQSWSSCGTNVCFG